MAGSMLSNQPITLKTPITIIAGTGATFEIFETGIILTRASIVWRNKLQLERMVVDIATNGICTIVLRGLDQSQTKTEVSGNKKERLSGAEGYVTVLASDLLDLDNVGDEQIIPGDTAFTGNLRATNATNTNLTVGGKFKGPIVADATARDALYPSPVDGNMVQVGTIGLQYYKASGGGWITLDEGTPTPQATESIEGKAALASNAEALAGTNDTKIMTPLKSSIYKYPEALYEKDQYLAGEALLANDSLFTEVGPTFAEATTVQNIGDATANTRVSFLAIGSGVSNNTLKLSLKKTLSPSANLLVRIETVSGGNPTGTLVDANATATVTAASITTSLVDTTILLGNTTTNSHGVTLNVNETNQTVYKGVKFTLTQQIGIVSVDKVAGCTATKVYLYDLTGNLLTSAVFSTNTATLNYSGLVNGQSYYVVVGSDGSSYTSVKQTGSASFPYIGSKLNYIGGLNKSVDSSDVSNNNSAGSPQAFNTGGTLTFSVTNSCKLSSFTSSSHTITGNCELRTNSGVLIETAIGNNFSGNTVLVKGTNYRIQYAKASSGPNLSSSLALTAGKNITYVSDSVGANLYLGNYTIGTLGHYDDNIDVNNIVSMTSVDTLNPITRGQQVAIVVSAVGDVVNASNFYGMGVLIRNTNTRIGKRRNGFLWSDILQNITDNAGGLTSTQSTTSSDGQRILVNKNIFITQLLKVSACTATRARIFLNGGGLLATATFSGDIATLSSPLYAVVGTSLRVEYDNNGATYNSRNSTPGAGVFPAGTNISYIIGSVNQGDISNINCNISGIVSYEDVNSFGYVSSTLFENILLSKTSASFSYKLPTDYVRLATQAYSVGQSVKSKYYGLHNYPGLVNDTIYYIANTPGAISAVAGSNPYNIGRTSNTNILKIDGKVLNRNITVSSSPFTYINTTGGPIQVSITGGTVNPIVINGVTTATATNHINTLPAGATMTVTYTVLPTITYSEL